MATTSESAENAPTMAWKCIEIVEGIEEVFTGYDFSGNSDWNEDSINLTQPDNAEMTVSF